MGQLVEPNLEIPFGISQRIKRPPLSEDSVYLYENDFKIGQANDPNCFN